MITIDTSLQSSIRKKAFPLPANAIKAKHGTNSFKVWLTGEEASAAEESPIGPDPAIITNQWKHYFGPAWKDGGSQTTVTNKIRYALALEYEYIMINGSAGDTILHKNAVSNLNTMLKFYLLNPLHCGRLYSTAVGAYPALPGQASLDGNCGEGNVIVLKKNGVDYTYTQAQKDWYNARMAWGVNTTFPNNLATGNYSDTSANNRRFEVKWDVQQQAVITELIARIIAMIQACEAANFTFAGYGFDVSNLNGDFHLLNTGTLSQPMVKIDSLTGNSDNSCILHAGITHDYATYADGMAAFYKQLKTAVIALYPNMKWIIDPAYIYRTVGQSSILNEWVTSIKDRSDKADLIPDLIMQEHGDSEAPPSTTVAADAAAGNLNGDYKYLVTFVISGAESERGAISETVSPANKKVNVTNIPVSSNAGCTARKIYRTTGGGSTATMKLVATISDNSTTSYLDNIADGSLGAQPSNSSSTYLFLDQVENFTTTGVTITKDMVGTHQRQSGHEDSNRVLAGKCGIEGAWYNWFGQYSLSGGSMPSFSSIVDVYPRLKLIRCIPGFDNLNQIPSGNRTWDGAIYTSKQLVGDTTYWSYIDSTFMFTRSWKNNTIIYVVFMGNGSFSYPAAKNITTASQIQNVDNLFQASGNGTGITYDNTAKTITYNGGANANGVGYIITLA